MMVDQPYIHAAVALNPPTGVARQMKYESDAAAALGLAWSVWLGSGSDLPRWARRCPAPLRASLLRIRFYARLIRLSRRGQCIVLRYSPGDPFLFAACHFFKTYYTVHHTFEEDELAVSSFRSARLQLALERLLGRRVVARARGIICVTPEIARYERQRTPGRTEGGVIVYPNGIAYGDTVRTPPDLRGERTEVVFVASHFVHWHGLEALLASLTASATEGVLHLVGAVPDQLLQRAQRDPRVRVHGVLNPSGVDEVVARGWVGLSSFSLAEKGMTEACTLKVREYLRAGVPAYAGHRDSGLPADFAYFRYGAPDWDAIVAYARATRGVARDAVSGAARPFIDKAVLLQRLYQSLEALPEESPGLPRAGEPSKP
jgi:glycosyltransferase involved in cell wall biosynthesis